MTPIAMLRARAAMAQGGACFYCGVPMYGFDLNRDATLSQRQASLIWCTAEHLHALRDGGLDTADNVVAACAFCNRTRHRAKHPLQPDQYRSRVRQRVVRKKWPTVRLGRIGRRGGGTKGAGRQPRRPNR